MMLSTDLIRQLKQTSISVDADKTRERVETVWKASRNSEKQAVIDQSGVARGTIYRIYKMGKLSAKLAVPIAQTLNVNPYYLLGETDENSECSEQLLIDFLNDHGYQHLTAQLSKPEPKKTRRRRKNIEIVVEADKPETTTEAEELEDTAEIDELENAAEIDDEPDNADAEPEKVDEYEEEIVEDSAVCCCQEPKAAACLELSDDDMVILLRAALLRAKAGGSFAELIDKIKNLLLS